MMDTNTLIVIIVLLVCGIIISILLSGGGVYDDDSAKSMPGDKIYDADVDVFTVLYHLERFKLSTRNSFSEKDVHGELESYLKNIFYSVSREHAIEGKNVKRVDFDLGNGMVGIEVKLAESVLKESENDRLIGQVQKYIGRKYKQGNLVIALAGYEQHTRNTIIHEIKQDVERAGAHFVFLKAKPVRIKQQAQ